MKDIFNVWWDKGNKCFSIRNYKKSWKENGNKPRIDFFENGGRKKNGDNCFDVCIIIGYTIFNYTDFNLQRKRR